MTTVTLSRAVLAAALDSVRFAVSSDPELPMLAGVLVDAEADGVTFVATDRYRMAIHREPAIVDGPATRVVAPVSWVDRLRDDPGRDEPVVLHLERVRIEQTHIQAERRERHPCLHKQREKRLSSSRRS